MRKRTTLREAIVGHRHRAALIKWIDELDEEHGTPALEQLAAADALLDALERGEPAGGEITGRPGAS